ncbi:hypothetical protein XELAEV_18039593mg [Xenopus laevis]|uniref:Uncharacterized protein n=1 Tax=Xenopus laevis TaxID=8355 RepID=A0A974C7V7_XENLA|nr:hypothetical protein XELAEV_18039593mg [Xenopus laevis]
MEITKALDIVNIRTEKASEDILGIRNISINKYRFFFSPICQDGCFNNMKVGCTIACYIILFILKLYSVILYPLKLWYIYYVCSKCATE